MSTYDDCENTLVSANDLKATEVKKPSKWSDLNVLSQLQQEMKALEQVKVVKQPFSENVLMKALADVLHTLNWSTYESFQASIQGLLDRSIRIPFSQIARDRVTGERDFWLIRVFVPLKGAKYLSHTKKEVLLSKEFHQFLRTFIREQLNGEVHFTILTGDKLDLSKLPGFMDNDLRTLPTQSPFELVMVQFKKKSTEKYIESTESVNSN